MFVTHYVPKNISGINLKTDRNISIIGKIVDSGENVFTIEDGSGKVDVVFEGEAEKGKLVRVFCSVLEGQLKADAIQDLKGFDLKLFNRVKELYNKAGIQSV